MNEHISDLIDRYPALTDCATDIESTFVMMRDCYRSGGKALICGNGGSAADAEHWAGELMKGFRLTRPLPDSVREQLDPKLADSLQGALPTIPLTGFVSLGSAFANDADPEYVTAQMVWGLGRKDDVLVGISTSGNSQNIVNALKTASAVGMKTIGLSGADGGLIGEIADICIRVPAKLVHHIQEYHVPVYHCLSAMLEDEFFGGIASC